MKKIIYIVILALMLAGAYLAGSWHTRQAASRNSPAPTGSGGDEGDRTPGTVKVSPEKQQVIGVQVGLAERTEGTRTVRTIGRVAVDENRIYRLVSSTEGWLHELQGGTTGSLVKKDQLLAKFSGRDIINRDIISGQQTLFLALNALERNKGENASEEQLTSARKQVLAAEKNLLAIGMSEAQIKELERTRQIAQEIEIRSPVTGFVLARNVFPNLRYDRNTELYRIADISRVWILADVYENEAKYFKSGTVAKVTLPYQDKSYLAKGTSILPVFDPTTRTYKVRLEVDNPGYALRPDMFVDVEFLIQLAPAVTVPAEAVLDTGLKKTVFVDQGQGFFEPRDVKTGWRSGNRVEIPQGLAAGERIAVSGTFLLDSESRMDLAAAGMTGGLSKDPVCGQEVSIRKAEKAGRKSDYRGKTYYFSSEECRARFLKDPDRYAEKPSKEPPFTGPIPVPKNPKK